MDYKHLITFNFDVTIYLSEILKLIIQLYVRVKLSSKRTLFRVEKKCF